VAKLLSIIVLILSIVLFPPTVLAVISNNAVPGDSTYPLKRILEDGIYAVASLNSTSKAWFSAARSDRRFKELNTLLAQGKSAEKTINELVSQTEIAAREIEQITDPEEKEKFVKQLVDSIQKYDLGLAQISQSSPSSESSQIAQAEITPEPAPSARVTPTPKSKPTITLSPTSIPTSTPAPSPSPITPPIVPPSGGDDQAAEEARKRLKEIEDELRKAAAKLQKEDHKKEKNDQDKRKNQDLTPSSDTDKMKEKSNEGVSRPGAGDDESSRQQRNSQNEKQ